MIAIENVRLFDEVQVRTGELSESLTYQTSSANILRVIASSPTDIKPVLPAIRLSTVTPGRHGSFGFRLTTVSNISVGACAPVSL